MMRTSDRGIALIVQFEGFRPTAYFCPAGIPTIGYGHTKGLTRADVINKTTISKAQAFEYLHEDVGDAERAVNAVKLPAGVRLNQCQFDALVSLVYNTGPVPLKLGVGSALRQGKLNMVPSQIMKWIKAENPKTKVLETKAGLVRRRNAETAMWRSVDPKAAFPLAPVPASMPVHVAGEDTPEEEDDTPSAAVALPDKPLSESGTIRGAAIAGIGGISVAVQSAQPVIEQVQQAQTTFQAVKDFGTSGLVIGVVILAVGIGYIVYRRYRDRHFL